MLTQRRVQMVRGTQWVCGHEKVPGMLAGWLVCRVGCGWVGVCRACLVEMGLAVPQEVVYVLCRRHGKLVESGQYQCQDGYVEPVKMESEAGGKPVNQRKER